MFDHHRKSPWFAEKYDPEFQNLRFRVRKEGWKGRINMFLDDLESGKFDPTDFSSSTNETDELEQPSSPAAATGVGAKETSSNNNENTIESNGTIAEESSSKPSTSGAGAGAGAGDDEMQFTVEADEEAVDPDIISRVETNGKHSSSSDSFNKQRGAGAGTGISNRGEEISVPTEGNQVMIRTIPPDIGRVKLEEVRAIF